MKRKGLSLDATTIILFIQASDWAQFQWHQASYPTGFGLQTIEQLYQKDWQIRPIFSGNQTALKAQVLFGSSKNAVQTQVCRALIAILLMRIIQPKNEQQHFSN